MGLQLQSVLGIDITSAPVMSWPVHSGVGPNNSSHELCIQFSEVPMGCYNPPYNSTCNKAELIWGFQNTLAILSTHQCTGKQDVKNPKAPLFCSQNLQYHGMATAKPSGCWFITNILNSSQIINHVLPWRVNVT